MATSDIKTTWTGQDVMEFLQGVNDKKRVDALKLIELMEKESGPDLQRPDTQWFATYATLMRGLGYEREYAAWCGWLADQLQRFIDNQQAGATQETSTAG